MAQLCNICNKDILKHSDPDLCKCLQIQYKADLKAIMVLSIKGAHKDQWTKARKIAFNNLG